jgi:hypothetical protein
MIADKHRAAGQLQSRGRTGSLFQCIFFLCLRHHEALSSCLVNATGHSTCWHIEFWIATGQDIRILVVEGICLIFSRI